MSDPTWLDRAHAAMEAGGEAERRLFYATLAAITLYVPLERAAEAERIAPMVLDTGEGRFALGFDTELRLAGFVPGGADYAGFAGRDLLPMLAGQGIGLGVNLETAPSGILLPKEVLEWIAGRLAAAVAAEVCALAEPGSPGDPALVPVLDAILPMLSGLVPRAVLTGEGPELSPALALLDAREADRRRCRAYLGEAFAILESPPPPVAFLNGSDPRAANVLERGIVIDLSGPGPVERDPDRPPRLI